MRILVQAASIAVLGLVAVGTSARHVGAQEGGGPILPGYWESTSTASFPSPSSKTERKCITARAINAYLTGPVNSHYSCRYDTRDLKGGHAHMTGECTDSSGIKGKVTIDGDYGPEAFKLNGKLIVTLLGLKIPVDTSIDARRISGECPAGAKIEDGGRAPEAKVEAPASEAPKADAPPPPSDTPPPPASDAPPPN